MRALVFDKPGRLAAVEQIGDPRGLAAFCAEPVELLAGAEEEQEPVAQLFDFLVQFRAHKERAGRNPPILFVEQPALRQGGVNRAGALLRAHVRILSAWRINSSALGADSNKSKTRRTALCASTCL